MTLQEPNINLLLFGSSFLILHKTISKMQTNRTGAIIGPVKGRLLGKDPCILEFILLTVISSHFHTDRPSKNLVKPLLIEWLFFKLIIDFVFLSKHEGYLVSITTKKFPFLFTISTFLWKSCINIFFPKVVNYVIMHFNFIFYLVVHSSQNFAN